MAFGVAAASARPRISASSEVCEVRYRQRNWVIDWILHSTAQAAMVELARDVGLTPERVLDFGTGSGVSAETPRTVLATRVVGCDMSWETLAAARIPKTIAVAPDGPLPFVSRVFDLVHCLFVMHFKIPDRMLQELRRCTAEQGYLAANCGGLRGSPRTGPGCTAQAGNWQSPGRCVALKGTLSTSGMPSSDHRREARRRCRAATLRS